MNSTPLVPRPYSKAARRLRRDRFLAGRSTFVHGGLRIAPELYAALVEVSQMAKHRFDAFPAEAVQGEDAHHVEALLASIEEHLLEAGAVCVATRLFVDILLDYGITGALGLPA